MNDQVAKPHGMRNARMAIAEDDCRLLSMPGEHTILQRADWRDDWKATNETTRVAERLSKMWDDSVDGGGKRGLG